MDLKKLIDFDRLKVYDSLIRDWVKNTITGDPAFKGDKGEKGEKGDPFLYSDFTTAQLNALKGKDGRDGNDGADGYTPVKGVDYFDGKAFTFDDFTDEQLASLKGSKGDDGSKGDRGDRGYSVIPAKLSSEYNFTREQWTLYGTIGRDFNWSGITNADDYEAGDVIMIHGTVSDEDDTRCILFGRVTRHILGDSFLAAETTAFISQNKDGADVDLTPYAEKKYVEDSVYNAMHRSRSVRKLNTHQRNFTSGAWDNYGAVGHIENWSNTSNYQDFKLGDLGVLYGTNTTNGKFVALVGEVTQVASSLQMRTLACYQSDSYKEVTEYGIDFAEDLANAIQDIESLESSKADKSEIPTVPKNVSAFNNDAGYLKEHQDISGKLDVSTFNDYTTQAEAIISQFQTWSATEQRARTQADDAYGLAIEDLQMTIATKANASEIPTKVSQLENDEKYLSEVKSDDIQPIAKKTYQNIIATSNDNAGGAFYCFKVRPKSYYETCRITFKVRAYINESMTGSNKGQYRQETYCTMFLSGNALVGYQNKNWYYTSSYRPYYYTAVNRTSKTGYDAGLTHYVGVNLYNSTNPTNTTLKRDIEIELLEVEGCTVEVLDEMVKQSSFYNATNYAGVSNCDAASAGIKQTGDSNSIDRLSYGSYLPKALGSMYGSQLVLSADGENYFSICTSRSTALTKKCNTQGFRPEHIMYYSSTTTISNGSRVATSTLYEALPFDFRFSHNVKALTLHKPVYLKCTYRDGLYYLVADGWMTQDLPTTEDGCYYILVGYSYSANNIYIKTVHPVYSYYNGACRKINGEVIELLGVIERGSY